jgi:hypothetical protein
MPETKYIVKNNIPIPPPRVGRYKKGYDKYPTMEVGQSFGIPILGLPEKEVVRIQSNVLATFRYGRKQQRYVSRKMRNDCGDFFELRIWRKE